MLRWINVVHYHYDSTEPIAGTLMASGSQDDPVPSYASEAAAKAVRPPDTAYSTFYSWAVMV